MGFSSVLCVACEHPLLSPAATNELNGWMSDVVVLHRSVGVLRGRYDGYGRVEELSEHDNADAQRVDLWSSRCWHEACWEVAGCPQDTDPPSPNADDQGWFFNRGDHDLADPRGGRSPSTGPCT
jgi:hypothetical protein